MLSYLLWEIKSGARIIFIYQWSMSTHDGKNLLKLPQNHVKRRGVMMKEDMIMQQNHFRHACNSLSSPLVCSCLNGANHEQLMSLLFVSSCLTADPRGNKSDREDNLCRRNKGACWHKQEQVSIFLFLFFCSSTVAPSMNIWSSRHIFLRCYSFITIWTLISSTLKTSRSTRATISIKPLFDPWLNLPTLVKLEHEPSPFFL
jgi:hypothetical protein